MQKHHDGVEPRKLPHPVSTRWWSHLPLFRVLVADAEYHRGFLATYNKGKHIGHHLSEDVIYTLNVLLATLGPLEELCTVLAADKYVTASAVLPVMYLLEKLERAARAAADRFLDGDEEEVRCVLSLHSECSYP